MDIKKPLFVGEPVVFIDEHRQRRHALVTTWHGLKDGETIDDFRKKWGKDGESHPEPIIPCVNLVYVVGDESKTDPYGRQIERKTSVTHGSRQNPPNLGWCFLFPDDET